MKKLSITRKYFAVLVVCIVSTLLIGSPSCDRQSEEKISMCNMCPVDDPSWAGLADVNTIYPGSYLPDINVSSTPDSSSQTTGSSRNIAVDDTGKVHVAWIETKNEVRDVYYACSDAGTWHKTNVSRFPTEGKRFQARNVSLAVTPKGVPHIAWEVEIDNNNNPLQLDGSDNHYVYYVYGSGSDNSGDCPCPLDEWKTCGDTPYSPPSPAHIPGPGSFNAANVSRNGANSADYDAWNPAIALDNRYRPHITWHNEAASHSHKIFWVYCADGAWKTCGGADYHFVFISSCNAIVSQTNSVNYGAPAIAIDKVDNVHIAYHNLQSPGSIYYVRLNSGANGYDCQTPITISNRGIYASIAVNLSNPPCIAWEDGGVIKYVCNPGSPTLPGSIPGTQDCHLPCLALDRDDNSHLVFHCNSNDNKEIYYSYNWSTPNPPDNVSSNTGKSFSPSVALDISCNPHLLWTDETPEDEREALYVHLFCCKWTNCGIIKSKETNAWSLVEIEFYDCETGNTITIYGHPNLSANNADDITWSPSHSGTIAKYEEGLCAKYCLKENAAGSLQILEWQAVPSDDPCCCPESTHYCGCIHSLHYPKSSGIPINVEFLNECDTESAAVNFTIDSMLQAENHADYPGMTQHTMHDYLSQYPDKEMWCADIWVDSNDEITKWEMHPDRDPCCVSKCCDYTLTPLFNEIPVSLCAGKSYKLRYKLENNCPTGDNIEFNYLFPADGSVKLIPQGPFTVPGGGSQEITIKYTMPGAAGRPCTIRSHTFRWALMVTNRDCPAQSIEHRIRCKHCLDPL